MCSIYLNSSDVGVEGVTAKFRKKPHWNSIWWNAAFEEELKDLEIEPSNRAKTDSKG